MKSAHRKSRLALPVLLALALAACGARNFDKAGEQPPDWYYSRKGATAAQFRRDSRDCTVSRTRETSRNFLATFFLILLPGGNDENELPNAQMEWFACMDARQWQKVPKSAVDLLCVGIQSEGEYSRYAPPECVSAELENRMSGGELNALPKARETTPGGAGAPAEAAHQERAPSP